jgi:hypothetical protein
VDEERSQQEEPEEIEDLEVSEEQAEDVKGGLSHRGRPEDQLGK